MSSKNGADGQALAEGRSSRRPWSLAARLTAWYAGSAFALVLVVAVLLYWALVASLARDKELFLADEIHILGGFLRDRPEDTAELKREVEWESRLRRNAEMFIRIWDQDGRPVAETPGMGQLLPAAVFPPPAGADAEPGPGGFHSANGRSFQLVAARAKVGQTGGPVYTVQVAVDRTEEEAVLAAYRRHLGIVLALAAVVCVVGGYALASRGIRPVREITRAARQVRSTTLDQRLAVAGLPAELADLADTFNEMLDRLEESFSRLARFSADIAHELRTPLNNLRGEAEVALRAERRPDEYREVLGACLEECARLSRLVNSLLFLARAESPQARIIRGRVDVGRELEAIREFYEAAAAEAGVTLAVETDSAVSAELDRTLFQQAVGNLVENALAHTDAGGRVTVRLKRNGSAFCIEVTDTGRGIAEEHLPRLFDRFYRVDVARSSVSGGVGLGLAIVKSIAELHGGAVEITSRVGQGTSVTFSVPAGNGEMTKL
jgi:two-component system heavy metal sensor histidine kinase CusS